MTPFLRILLAVAAIAVTALAPCTALAGNDHGAIVVKITGFRNSSGRAGVLLFSQAKGFPMDQRFAVARLFAPVERAACRITLENIPYGTYAVSVFHDEDGDGKLRRTVFGIPREGVGASRNPGMRFGPPRFKDASFVLDSPNQQIEITVRYLHGQGPQEPQGAGKNPE